MSFASCTSKEGIQPNPSCTENDRVPIDLPAGGNSRNLCNDANNVVFVCPTPMGSFTHYDYPTLEPGKTTCICVLKTPPTTSSSPASSNQQSSSSITSAATTSPSSSQTTSSVPNPTPTASATSSTLVAASATSTSGNNSALATTSPPRPQKNGMSTGVTAGIGIGCAFAGALIAGLLLFFLFRRKRGAKHASIHPYPDGGYLPEGKIPMGATSSSTRGAVSNIDRLLPQPAEDDAIVGALSRIRDGIKNHVQNYYHQAAVRSELVDETEVFELARATGMPAATVRNLLLNPSTRIAAIRLYLAQLILSSCEGKHDYHASFLPQEIAALAASLSATENTKLAQPALFSKWKTITGALLQPQYGQALGDHDTRNPSVNRAMETAESVLRPFLDPGVDMHARRRNLEGTIKRAAQLAFVLFSQPASFHFDYSGTGQSDRLLVFPALLQIVSDEAEVLSPPRVLTEPEELDVGAGF